MNYHVLLIKIHEKMGEIAFQHSYLIPDHCKDVQIPVNQQKNLLKKKLKENFMNNLSIRTGHRNSFSIFFQIKYNS